MNTAHCMKHSPTWEVSSTQNLSKYVLEFYGTHCSVAMFTWFGHLSLSLSRLIHSMQQHPASLWFISIFFLHLLPKLSAISRCVFWLLVSKHANYRLRFDLDYQHYKGADKSLARPGRKKATATENFWVSYIIFIVIIGGILVLFIYTGCPRRNVPDFGRVFLMLKYTDITQNTCVQSWTVTEIMAREVWNFDGCYTLIDYQIHIKTGRNMWFLEC